MFNPWHDLSLGDDAPHEIQVLIEIPAKSHVKYELDKDSGLIRVDRILHSAVYYPTNYGLIPQTYCEDNDPLDVFVFSSEPLISNSIVVVRPVGIIHMEDGGEKDDKIIAVMVKDPEWGEFRHIKDLPPHRIRQLTQFLKDSVSRMVKGDHGFRQGSLEGLYRILCSSAVVIRISGRPWDQAAMLSMPGKVRKAPPIPLLRTRSQPSLPMEWGRANQALSGWR